MKNRKKNYVHKFIQKENLKIKKMNKIVSESIQSGNFLTPILEENIQKLSLGQKLADKVASFGGSWTFIISFAVFLFLWISLNIFFLSNRGFDPYPFILLNLILSSIAALQAPIIMMSQNRKEEIDRKRSENDYIINLKAEMQIKNMDKKIDMFITEQMKHLFKLQDGQLKILKEINKKIKK